MEDKIIESIENLQSEMENADTEFSASLDRMIVTCEEISETLYRIMEKLKTIEAE